MIKKKPVRSRKRKINKKKITESQIILILLIIFCALSIITIFTVKLADLNYSKDKDSAIKVSDILDIKNIDQAEAEKEIESFSGFISEVDLDKGKILVDIFHPEELKDARIYFFVKEEAEIVLSRNSEKISLERLLPEDLITITAISGKRDRWEAKKIEVEPIKALSGKVKDIEGKKILISRDFEDLKVSEMTYDVLISTRTKITIKNYVDAFGDDGSLDENKIVEKRGYLGSIKEGSYLIVKNKEEVIPREKGLIDASSIDIILKTD